MAILGAQQSVKLGSLSVPGVQSVNVGQDVNGTPVSCLGVGFLRQEFLEPTVGSVSIDRFVIGSDVLFTEEQIAGNYSFGSYGVSWTTGFINSFSLSIAANSIPSENITIETHGEFASQSSFSEPADGEIASSNTVTTNFGVDVIESLNYSVNINRETKYKIGSKVGLFGIIEPIEIETQIQYSAITGATTPTAACTPDELDIEIVLKNCDGTTIKTYTAPNSILQSVSYEGQVEGFMSATATYKSYIGTGDLAGLIS
jgi:hypothetical protein